MATRRPDGGWGWVIASAAFLHTFIVDGVKYSFGIMFLELIDAFGKSKSATSWIMSIQVAMSYGISLVAGALVNRFGCRAVAAVGALIGFVGFLLSPFAISVYYMYVTFGVIGGIGLGMGSLPMGVSLARFFDKHLALACGIRATGSGVGMLLFGPLSKLLIDEYTWRGTLLIESAFLLNGLLCAAVLRPVPKPKVERLIEHTEDDLLGHETSAINSDKDVHVLYQTDIKESINDPEDANNTLNDYTSTGVSGNPLEGSEMEESYIACLDGKSHNHICADAVPDKSIKSRKSENTINVTERDKLRLSCSQDESRDLNQPSKEMILAATQTVKSCRFQRCAGVNRNRRWLSLSSLREPRYLLLIGAAMLVELGLMTPFTFLPDMMSQAGYEKKDAVFMVFLIGLLSTLARIISGFVADLPFINRIKLCYAVMILNGVLVALTPLCFNYASYVAFAVLFGFGSGSMGTLRAVLLPDLFGVDMIADRLGIMHLFSGCAALVGLPITGGIYDVTGSYSFPFLVAGIELVASGVCVLIITLLRTS